MVLKFSGHLLFEGRRESMFPVDGEILCPHEYHWQAVGGGLGAVAAGLFCPIRSK